MSQVRGVETVEVGKNIIPVNLCCQYSDVHRPFYLRSINIKDKMQSYIKLHKIDPKMLSYIEVTQIPAMRFENGACLLWVNIKTHGKFGDTMSETMDQFHIEPPHYHNAHEYKAYPQRPDSFWEWDSPENNEAYNDL